MTVREDRDNRQRGGRKEIGDLASGNGLCRKKTTKAGLPLEGKKKNAPKAAWAEKRREGRGNEEKRALGL